MGSTPRRIRQPAAAAAALEAEFEQLFDSHVADLGRDLQHLLGGEGESPRATLYNPITGVEHLGGGLPGGLDTTV